MPKDYVYQFAIPHSRYRGIRAMQRLGWEVVDPQAGHIRAVATSRRRAVISKAVLVTKRKRRG